MSDTKLIEMVKMSQSKNERRHEYGSSQTDTGADEQWHSRRAKETFFCNGTLMI